MVVGMKSLVLTGLLCLHVSLGYLFAIALPSTTFPQSETGSGPAADRPKDPKALMLLAAEVNGLAGPSIKPWHLTAAYTFLNASGRTTDQGAIDVIWASNQKFKITYTGTNFSQTVYGTRSDRQQMDIAGTPPPVVLAWAVKEFVWPTLPQDALKQLKFEQADFLANSVKLVCLTLRDPHRTTMGGFLIPTYCLESNAPVLRIGSHEGDPHQFLRNNVFTFQGRYVPQDIVAVIANKPDLKVHLESLEALKAINDADFAPPKDARPSIPSGQR